MFNLNHCCGFICRFSQLVNFCSSQQSLSCCFYYHISCYLLIVYQIDRLWLDQTAVFRATDFFAQPNSTVGCCCGCEGERPVELSCATKTHFRQLVYILLTAGLQTVHLPPMPPHRLPSRLKHLFHCWAVSSSYFAVFRYKFTTSSSTIG